MRRKVSLPNLNERRRLMQLGKTIAAPLDLKELTSIRFFAALYVVLFHAYDSLPSLYAWDSGLIRNGYLGVDLFFILSGMVLTHVNIERVRAGTFRYNEFMLHRIARIYPLHVTMFVAFLVLYTIAGWAGLLKEGLAQNWGYAAQHLLLIHAWGTTQGHAWNGPSWSISAEFFAYLSFPIYLLLLRLWRPAPGLLVAAIVFALIWMASPILQDTRLTQRSYDFGILRIVPEFLLGVFLYQVARQVHTAGQISAGLLQVAMPLAIAAYLVAAHLDMHDPVLIFFMALLLFILALCSLGEVPNLMKHPGLVYLGEISYSTYMVHYIFLVAGGGLALKLFGSPAFPLWYWLALILAIYPASALSYHVVELPSRRAIRAWHSAKKSKA